MREILFRGQTRRHGEKVRIGDGMKLPSNWVYGGVLQGTGSFSIIYGSEKEDVTGADIEKYSVYSDTLGQYTGLKDKNGKRIFEGDICTIRGISYISERPFTIKYDEDEGGYLWEDIFNKDTDIFCKSVADLSEVVGNIYDNVDTLDMY